MMFQHPNIPSDFNNSLSLITTFPNNFLKRNPSQVLDSRTNTLYLRLNTLYQLVSSLDPPHCDTIQTIPRNLPKTTSRSLLLSLFVHSCLQFRRFVAASTQLEIVSGISAEPRVSPSVVSKWSQIFHENISTHVHVPGLQKYLWYIGRLISGHEQPATWHLVISVGNVDNTFPF